MEKVMNEKQNYFERPCIYKEQLLTLDDLNDFKRQMLFEIKNLLKKHVGETSKKYFKSKDVRKLLNISPGTLQNLRDNGTLPFRKLGSVFYHDPEDIQCILDTKKPDNKTV
jgi:hypothetical protein